MYMRLIHISAFLLLICACSEDNTKTITFETVSAEKTVALSNDSVPPTCNVSIHLEQATSESGRVGEIINSTVTGRLLNRADDGMQQAAQAYADDYTANYIKTLLPLYNQDRFDFSKHAWYHYHYIINSHTQMGCKGTVVYLADINYREGGDHTVSQQVIMNFETETGRQLTLSDIFIDGFEETLKPLLLNALLEKTGEETLKALQNKGYLTNTDIFVPENFILGSDAVTFVYNPDEIAPYTIGFTELTITYAAMEKVLKNSFEY